jgi:2-polyprenyl-3-methyl-5-hydroxy-6-metoxy-1,4-benzoquinol methylase
VFDVDGHVISPEDLVQRVEKLVRSIDARDDETVETHERPIADQADGTLGAPVMPMRAFHEALVEPPQLGAPAGAKGQAGNLARRLARKLTSWETEPRWTAQQNYDGHNIHFAMGVINELNRIKRDVDELRRQNVRLRLQVVGSAERLNRFRREIEYVIENLPSEQRADELLKQMERLGVASDETVIDYAAFEDRLRGSSDDLKGRQKHYLRFFPNPNGTGRVIDIGCGRGEMLEILIEAGYEAFGIDLNEDMIDVCRAKGLPVSKADAISFLQQVESKSLRGIFCAQVVEHLLTSELERFLVLAREKLLEGGVLVIETINPRSLFALGNHFFADNSHVKPVHPETLRFMCEQVGFKSVELVQESEHPIMKDVAHLPDDDVATLVRLLADSVFGYQDYAIVATK